MPVEKITEIDLPGQTRKLFKFENFKPLNSTEYYRLKDISLQSLQDAYLSDKVEINSETIIFDGPVYLFDITGFAYFHELYDKVLQYEFIKHYIPELRIIPVTNGDVHKKKNSSVWFDFFSIYGIEEKDIVTLWGKQDYVFSEVYNFIFEHNHIMNPFKKDLFSWEGWDPWANESAYKAYIEISSSSFKKRTEHLFSKEHNKKIFISRKKVNDYRRGQYDNDSNFFYSVRFISEKNEIALEDFFRKIGYEIVIAEDLSLIEQIKLYSSATHVSGIISSGFCNIIFCKPGTKIIPINLDDTMRVWYDSFAEYFGLGYLELPGRKLSWGVSPSQMTVFPHVVTESGLITHTSEYDFEKILNVLRDPFYRSIL
jgi:hypothetical protein